MALIMNKKLDWAGRSDEIFRRKCNCDFATQEEGMQISLFYFILILPHYKKNLW